MSTRCLPATLVIVVLVGCLTSAALPQLARSQPEQAQSAQPEAEPPSPALPEGELPTLTPHILPTPIAHYDSFDVRLESVGLLAGIAAEADLQTQLRIGKLIIAAELGGFRNIPPDDFEEVLMSLDWERWKRPIIEVMVHESHVFDLMPAKDSSWIPLLHDCFIFFFAGYSQERMVAHVIAQMRLPPDADAGMRLLQLTDRSPTLQKIGQILARNPGIPEEFRVHLQTLESGISTTSRDDLVALITESIGAETLREYQIEFADEVLAEASVGAVIRCDLTPPGEAEPERAVCKLVKPYAVAGLHEELDILSNLALFLEENEAFYGIGDSPISQMFRDIRDALEREINVTEEQRNFIHAGEYYRGSKLVKVPEIYGASNETVTFMEFVPGPKITDAYPDDPAARAELARRLSDALTYDVIFSPDDEAIFHGDPHAGNVHVMEDDPVDPYRLVLLDWGLMGDLSRAERRDLVQLFVGFAINDRRRVQDHVEGLLADPLPDSRSERRRIEQAVDDALWSAGGKDAFSQIVAICGKLSQLGYAADGQLLLFSKSQVTISGMIKELNPNFSTAQHFMRRFIADLRAQRGQRALNALWPPGWVSRDNPTMIANDDIRAVFFAALDHGIKGVQLLLGGMPPGSGFVGGLGYERAAGGGALESSLQARISNYDYRMVDALVTLPAPDTRALLRARVHGRYRDFKAVNFFGIGYNTPSAKSTFRMEDRSVRGALEFRPFRFLAIDGAIGYLGTGLAGGERDPSIEERFDTSALPGWDARPDYLTYGGVVAIDWQDVLIRDAGFGGSFEVEHFDARSQAFDFTRYMGKVRASVPLGSSHHLAAFHVHTGYRDASDGDEVPFYLLETLGGAQTIRAHREYRFREVRSLLASLEYRWIPEDPLAIVVFGDAGQVFDDWDQLGLRTMRTGVGVGVRLRMSEGSAFRIDVATGREEIKLHVGTGPDF